MSTDWLGYGYAMLVGTGGIIGYVKAGSVPSLAAGLLFGGLAGAGAYQLSQDPHNIWLSLAASGVLSAVMGMRFYNSGKLMPAGLIAGVRYALPHIALDKEIFIDGGPIGYENVEQTSPAMMDFLQQSYDPKCGSL